VPTDAASTTYGNGYDTCGERAYAITDATGAVPTWITAKTAEQELREITAAGKEASTATITAGNFALTVAQDLEAMVASSPHVITIKTSFVTYPVSADASHPTLTTTISVTFTAATCDCTLITWKDPATYSTTNAMVVTTPTTLTLTEAGPDPATLTSTAGARACDHANDECNYSYTITA
jgi:hypothetical protein